MSDRRTFSPAILETKQQLLAALKNGDIVCSKFNTLNMEQRVFVELVVFGEYSYAEAYAQLFKKPNSALAEKYASSNAVQDAIEELSVKRDVSFMQTLSSSRNAALRKLEYIMNSTKDEGLAAATAKTILDNSMKALGKQIEMRADAKKQQPVGGIKFAIQVNNGTPPQQYDPQDTVMVEADIEEPEPVIIEKSPAELAKDNLNPDTGLGFRFDYADQDNYNDD